MLWFLVILLVAIYGLRQFLQYLEYWKKRGVLQPSTGTILKEFINSMLGKELFTDILVNIYKQFPNARYNGGHVFFSPMLILRHPDVIKQITVKDFDHFTDHRGAIPDDVEPMLSKNLLGLKGQKWRDMRATLSPSFTSSKMKAMFVLISECAERFADFFVKDNNTNVVDVELKDIFSRLANDVIASSAFGVSCDSLAKRDNEFYLMGADATNFKGLWKNFKLIAIGMCPRVFKFFGITIFSKSVSKFFTYLVKQTIDIREKEGIIRPDMIHLLMEARKGRLTYEENSNTQKEAGFATVEESHVGKMETKKEMITDVDITAQAMIFFFAGFDTVSTGMSFMAYELAVNPEIQEKLYQEIVQTLDSSNGKLTYDVLLKMKYLDMVVSESLRKWPPALATDRACVKPYTIQPVDKNETPVDLSEGEVVFVPIFAIHRDEKYYPDPERFDPERFADENKDSINPYTYMPFGAGPRSCIGSRFALLEMKAVFVHLLTKCEIVVTEKTQIPLKFLKRQFNLTPEHGFRVGLKPRIK